MRIIAVASYAELSTVASTIVTQAVSREPHVNIVFPTGRSPIGLYGHLRAEHAAGRFSLNHAHVFMLDEYVDLPSHPEGSFRAFLLDHRGDVVFNSSTKFHSLIVDDEVGSCRRYDRELTLAGDVDLAIVGVGRNGHVGFNEPAADRSNRTHIVKLTASTIEANFPCQSESLRPTRAITMGLRDLIEARSILMLVSGPSKAPILAALRDGIIDPAIPATHFLDHPDFTIIADEEALASA